MFRHKGKRRAYIHNLRLASILSFIAGLVNIGGLMAVRTLTTNVTGHFAYFSEAFAMHSYHAAFTFLLFILSFLSGAFVSNLLIEIVLRRKPGVAHAAPISIEIILLSAIGFAGGKTGLQAQGGELIACTLLFAMGIQNSLVTKVSDSVVRTTHLTGLFTDLGIELSQLFFYRQRSERSKLSKSIYLRLSIIGFFFLGCVIGGYLFRVIQLKLFCFASLCLVIALFYDSLRYRYYILKRKNYPR